MRTSRLTLAVCLILVIGLGCSDRTQQEFTQYVDPFIGTGGHGHTFPGATLPFGMVQLSPDTRLEGWDGCSGYHYTDSVIYGFSHTHLSGTGVSDYGDVLLMPIQGDIQFDNGYKTGHENGYASPFQKATEKASPGYYEVSLEDHNIDVRLSTTTRVGIHEYTFENGGTSHIILDLDHRDRVLESGIQILDNSNVIGSRVSSAWATEQHIYYAISFSKPFEEHVYDTSGRKSAFTFDMKEGEELMIKVAISAVDTDGAQKNLEAEAEHWNFDTYKKEANKIWQEALGKIEVIDPDEEKKTIFYTALYHSMIAPNTFSDVDGKYRGMDGEVHQSDGTTYTVFSFWDTFRGTHPLYTIIEQERTNEFIQTLLRQYEDGGILPIWELAGNYTGCMIGYHAIPVIADAYIKDIRSYDTELALEAMLHSARQDKLGLEAYKSQGYISVADESESVSKTLEYAYDDWCIAKMAATMGKHDVYDEYIERAQYYKNLFNPNIGFMQSKMNGAWSYGFDPAEVNFNFTEANSWQYSMFAPQDIQGLIDIYGGVEAFESKLDQLFTTEMELSGRHQVDITGLIGQYAHGNEPSHHMAYLYNYLGKPYKTQSRINQILNELYTIYPDGLSGNEDCGQMSSWYVLSSMGFYSVTPGMDYYAIGAPQFEEVRIHLENGNTFTIKADKQNGESHYIQSAALNGSAHDKSFLNHNDIIQGGVLSFELGSEPNESWATEGSPESNIAEIDKIVSVPYFVTDDLTFTDSLKVEIKSVDSNAEIYFSSDRRVYTKYDQPFYIYKDTHLSAYAQIGDKRSFVVDDAKYKKIRGGRSLELISEYSNQYAAGGDKGLINYLKGGTDFRTGYWQGYYGMDFSAIVTLGEGETVNRISLGALQDIKSWIWYPKSVIISISNDGTNFHTSRVIENEFSDEEYGGYIQEFTWDFDQPKTVRYVKVEAENYGACPSWHLGDGHPTWLFFDEITIE